MKEPDGKLAGVIFGDRPHWQVLVFHYGLAAVVVWQLAEDLVVGQGKIYSGAFAPWRQYVDYPAAIGFNPYPYFVAAETVLIVLFLFRVRLTITAALLAIVIFLDNLGSFLNHRLLIAIELFLYSFYPVRKSSQIADYRKSHGYWSMDLIRLQLSVVYVVSAIHKCNPHFLSGRTLENLFWMIQNHGMMSYPDRLFQILSNAEVCHALAWMTVFFEFAIGLLIHFDRIFRWLVPGVIVFHVSIGILMPHIWIFTALIAISLVGLYPLRKK